jgi:hypothetical protein
MNLRVRFSQKKDQLITDNVKQYFEMHDQQCIAQFLPSKFSYTIVEESEKADICFCGVQHEDNDLLRDNEINILLSVENLGCGRTHYKFHNKFGDMGNYKIDVYIHNHFTDPFYDDVITNTNGDPMLFTKDYPRVIPTAFFRMRFFHGNIPKFSNIAECKYEDKKFCLFVSKNNLNENKTKCASALLNIGDVDFIMQKQFDYLVSKPCLHGVDLIKAFSKYKFIICFENSNTPGYITEKIFNVFLAKSIPIYDGAQNIGSFVNPKAFVSFDERCIQKIRILNASKELYERVIAEPKLLRNPNNPILESYLDHHIETKLKSGFI